MYSKPMKCVRKELLSSRVCQNYFQTVYHSNVSYLQVATTTSWRWRVGRALSSLWCVGSASRWCKSWCSSFWPRCAPRASSWANLSARTRPQTQRPTRLAPVRAGPPIPPRARFSARRTPCYSFSTPPLTSSSRRVQILLVNTLTLYIL